jgi:hypothetical protein
MNELLIHKAQKSKSNLRIGISGTSGSGKTYSALLLASGLTSWDKVCIIDTENGSADLYDNLGPFNVITITAPYSPERYIEAIHTAEAAGMEVIIIDSITHEWNGEGGCLDIQNKLGGRFQDWAKVTPRHDKFKYAILQSSAHVITTVRSKTDYAMNMVDGRAKVEKLGLKQETREGFEYELMLALDLNQNHLALISKDRTGLFMGKPEFIITSDTGKMLIEWANTGAVYTPPMVKQEPSRAVSEAAVEVKAISNGKCPECKATMSKAGKIYHSPKCSKKYAFTDKSNN